MTVAAFSLLVDNPNSRLLDYCYHIAGIADEHFSAQKCEAQWSALERAMESVPKTLSAQDLVSFVSNELGFVGNRKDYYDRDNSLIHKVLLRRTGIPISLAVVYMELARRQGMVLQGVNFPGHFLLFDNSTADPCYIDPFSGQILQQAQCQDILQAQFGPSARLQGQHLQTINHQQMVFRMLGNLKQIEMQSENYTAALNYIEHLSVLSPQFVELLRDRAFCYEQLGMIRAAISAYKALIPQLEDEELKTQIKMKLQHLKQQPESPLH